MKVKRNITILLIIAVAAIVSVQFQPEPQIAYSHATWPEKYETIEDLTTSPKVDLIIVGTVVKSTPYKEYTSDNSKWFITSNHTIKVVKTLKGKQMTTVQVHQDGGTLDKLTEIMMEDPLMEPKDEVVLFLHEFDKDKYYVEGGPQGRFIIKENEVYGLGEIHQDSHVAEVTKHLDTGGITITSLEKTVNDSIN